MSIHYTTVEYVDGDVILKRPVNCVCRMCKERITDKCTKFGNIFALDAYNMINIDWIILCSKCTKKLNKSFAFTKRMIVAKSRFKRDMANIVNTLLFPFVAIGLIVMVFILYYEDTDRFYIDSGDF